MEARAKRLCSGIALGTILVMALVLLQPTMQQANAVGVEGLPGYDNCRGILHIDDPISMNTFRSGNIVKTIHAEKEQFDCELDQGGLRIVVDVTTYVELYENIVDREVIAASALVTTCLKEPAPFFVGGATVIDCESYVPSTRPVPVTDCREMGAITHPQEMNTVNKGSIAKTIDTQKEVFLCEFGDVGKKVDVILFTEVYEDLNTQTVIDVQFHSMRCVALWFDHSDDLRDATVETCQFSGIEN